MLQGLVEIGLTDLQKSGHIRHPRRQLAENRFWYWILLCEPCPNWKSIMDLIDWQGKKTEMNDCDYDRKNKIQRPSFSLSATGLFWCGRLWYWTILRWEILLLDFFAVGDCGTGLFCCGRFYCWTFLLWEILMLDFLASGQMNCTAVLGTLATASGALETASRVLANTSWLSNNVFVFWQLPGISSASSDSLIRQPHQTTSSDSLIRHLCRHLFEMNQTFMSNEPYIMLYTLIQNETDP